MPYRFLCTAFIVCVTVCTSLAHAADVRNLGTSSTIKRVALVIGNAAYPGAGALKNPANDATDIAAKLKKLGFDVTVRTDMPYRDMLRALTDFGDKVQQGSEALFFYAGHGMQVRGKNYLIPIDAQIRNESAVSSEAVDVDQLLDKLAPARLSMVILDACRNNPFERRFRGSGQGLASINAPTGTLIAYATAPGKVAADGEGRNGLYTQELLTAMDVPGVRIEDVFMRVRANVIKKSGTAQTPWESSSLVGDPFYFVGGQLASLGPQIVGARTKEQIEDELWDAIKDDGKASVFEEYIRQYPNGRYLAQARVKLAGLRDAARPAPAAEPPRIAVSPAPTFAAPARSDDPETDFWNEVKTSGAREYFDAYLKQYPKGKYVALAKIELKRLDDHDKATAAREKQEQARVEQAAWDNAKNAGTAAAYADYLGRYPKGRYAALAQVGQQKAQRDDAEKEKHEAAQRMQEEERQKLAAERERLDAEKAAKEMRPGKVFKDCTDCPEMVIVPAGSFDMGGTKSNETPVHRVTLKGFALGKTEVTQGQWRAVMGSNPSHFSNCGDDCPVEQVNWSEAQEFVGKLSRKTGKTYRLPSEAEWEYACRAGGTHTYCGSENIDSAAWYASNSGGTTHPVAGKQANAWGLHDMSGNVWEWVEDCWNINYNGAPTDGSAWTSGNCGARVLRGGSWIALPQDERAAVRNWYAATFHFNSYGFRPARMLP